MTKKKPKKEKPLGKRYPGGNKALEKSIQKVSKIFKKK